MNTPYVAKYERGGSGECKTWIYLDVTPWRIKEKYKRKGRKVMEIRVWMLDEYLTGMVYEIWMCCTYVRST